MNNKNRDLRLAVMGLDGPGNGHPFSFSAIINNYQEAPMREAGWGVIADYLSERQSDEFGIDGVKITHAWTQDPDMTQLLCKAGNIPNACKDRTELYDREVIDAVLLARDDGHSHWEFAQPFLDLGIPVLVDKPLCTSLSDYRKFEPYIRNGLIMSAAGMKYAPELSQIKGTEFDLNSHVIRGIISNGWDRYAIHIIDGLLGSTTARPTSVFGTALSTDGLTATIRTNSQQHWIITAAGDGSRVARFDWTGPFPHKSVDITSNFLMFRTLLHGFIKQVRTGEPQRDPKELALSIQILAAARNSVETQAWVDLQ